MIIELKLIGYITKTQAENKKIGDTFTFHKTKNCDDDKNVSCECPVTLIFHWTIDCKIPMLEIPINIYRTFTG